MKKSTPILRLAGQESACVQTGSQAARPLSVFIQGQEFRSPEST
jgi:hypothetical protein